MPAPVLQQTTQGQTGNMPEAGDACPDVIYIPAIPYQGSLVAQWTAKHTAATLMRMRCPDSEIVHLTPTSGDILAAGTQAAVEEMKEPIRQTAQTVAVVGAVTLGIVVLAGGAYLVWKFG